MCRIGLNALWLALAILPVTRWGAANAVSAYEVRAAAGDDASAERRWPSRLLYPICRNRRWGFIDREGKIVVAPKFTAAGEMFQGRALINEEGQAGFIDTRGEIAFMLPGEPGDIRQVQSFAEGIAWFNHRGKWGAVDRTGQIEIEPQYDSALPFSEGLAAVNRGRRFDDLTGEFEPGIWGYINRRGEVVLAFHYESAESFRNGLAMTRRPGQQGWPFIDRDGRFIFSARYPSQDPRRYVAAVGNFSQGLARVATSPYAGPYAGYLNRRGEFAIAPQFDRAGDFSEDAAMVCLQGKCGFIDRNGKWIIKPQFEDARLFGDGIAAVRNGRTWMFVNRRGSPVVKPELEPGKPEPPAWNDIESFRGGLARVHIGGTFEVTDDGPARWRGGAWYYVDRRGARVALYKKDDDD